MDMYVYAKEYMSKDRVNLCKSSRKLASLFNSCNMYIYLDVRFRLICISMHNAYTLRAWHAYVKSIHTKKICMSHKNIMRNFIFCIFYVYVRITNREVD